MPARLLPVSTHQTAIALAETMFGEGVTVVSATYTGDPAPPGSTTAGTRSRPASCPLPRA